MSQPLQLKDIDFMRYPYRGIYAEIARELGLTRVTVRERAERGDTEMLVLIAEKIQKRNRAIERYNDAISLHS